jgi:hypothetical protein
VVDIEHARKYLMQMGNVIISATNMGKRSPQWNSAVYSTEKTMVRDLTAFVVACNGPVRCRQVTHEFDYSSGRTDLVGLGNNDALHAFEAKLTKWRDALHQARRNGCFAHYCYVALPNHAASLAIKAKEDFVRHGVGLVVVNKNEAKLAIRPRRNTPLLPWLTESALSQLESSCI